MPQVTVGAENGAAILVGMHWSRTIGFANPSNIVTKIADRLIADGSGA